MTRKILFIPIVILASLFLPKGAGALLFVLSLLAFIIHVGIWLLS